MKVPFLDLKIQYQSMKEEVNEAIQIVLDNTDYVLGKPVSNFENAFSKAHNAKYCYGVSSGTDGNHIVLWALDIGHGDEVIMPVNTFIATSWGATLNGAKPVFVDCDPLNYNIDSSKIEEAITVKTKAIVAVHLYGQAADMDPLKEIAEKNNLYLVEDAAQAHLGEYKGQKIGTLSHASSFSFYPGKNLGAFGEAGAVMTNNDELAAKFKMLRDHGAHQKYNHIMYGHNYRMEGIQGAVLSVKLKYLLGWTEKRRRIAARYNELLKGFDYIKTPVEMEYAKHVYHLYVIQVKDSGRDKLMEYLKDNEITCGLHYPIPLHLQPCFKDLGYKEGDFPVSEELAQNGLSLPIYPEMTEEQITYVADTIKKFWEH